MSFSSWVISKGLVIIGIKNRPGGTKPSKKPGVPSLKIKKKYNVEEESYKGFKTYKLYKNKENKKAILFLHGGAYKKGLTNAHWSLMNKLLKKMDVDAYVLDYPIIPYTYKEAIDMVEHVYKEMLDEYDAKDITIMGDSAGGGLALGFCMYLRDNNIVQPGKNVMISPWLDLSMENPQIKERDYFDPWLNIEDLKDAGVKFSGKEGPKFPYCSPIYGRLQGICKMYIFFGSYDILSPDGIRFDEICKKEGIDLTFDLKEKMLHTYPMLPIKEAKEAICKMVDFILG